MTEKKFFLLFPFLPIPTSTGYIAQWSDISWMLNNIQSINQSLLEKTDIKYLQWIYVYKNKP